MPNDVMTIEAEVLADLTIKRPPATVLEEARQAAVALKDVLDSKPNKVMMNEEQYLEFEDWQTVGKFYGVTCCEEGDPVYVEFGLTKGFKASSVALHNGKTISRATAFCLTDEEKWGERKKYAWAYCKKSGGTSVDDPGPAEIIWMPNPNKPGRSMPKKERIQLGVEQVPFYQLASMAQTRANSKVLRNVLSWVVVLAGYKPTPAEEMIEANVVARQPSELETQLRASLDQVHKRQEMEDVGTTQSLHANSLPPVANQDASSSAHNETDDGRQYLDRIALSQSVRECSAVINEGLADTSLSVFAHTSIQDTGKKRILELRKK